MMSTEEVNVALFDHCKDLERERDEARAEVVATKASFGESAVGRELQSAYRLRDEARQVAEESDFNAAQYKRERDEARAEAARQENSAEIYLASLGDALRDLQRREEEVTTLQARIEKALNDHDHSYYCRSGMLGEEMCDCWRQTLEV